jgi:hypothetical protein
VELDLLRTDGGARATDESEKPDPENQALQYRRQTASLMWFRWERSDFALPFATP